jgi:3-hydroxyisobutyrate dehydrogenase
MAKEVKTIAFCGLGAMGFPMAGHLAKLPGVRLLVWNRTFSRAKLHSEQFGSCPVSEVTQLAEASVVFSCLPTSETVLNVMESFSSARPMHSRYWVDCTSGDPLLTRQAERIFKESGGRAMVDAPVSGGPAGAIAGSLSVIVGGEQEAVDEVSPLLDCFAKPGGLNHVGPLGAGHAVKAINNVLNVTNLMCATEGLAALTKIGVDPEAAVKAINQSSGRSLMTQDRIPQELFTGNYNYGFKLGLMRKDVAIANAVLDEAFPSATFLRMTKDKLAAAVEKYGGDVDYTYAAKLIEDEAGQPLRAKGKGGDTGAGEVEAKDSP